jgi:hypothetical protein
LGFERLDPRRLYRLDLLPLNSSRQPIWSRLSDANHEKEIAQYLRDIRIAVVATAIFLHDGEGSEKRDRAYKVLMSVARDLGIEGEIFD